MTTLTMLPRVGLPFSLMRGLISCRPSSSSLVDPTFTSFATRRCFSSSSSTATAHSPLAFLSRSPLSMAGHATFFSPSVRSSILLSTTFKRFLTRCYTVSSVASESPLPSSSSSSDSSHDPPPPTRYAVAIHLYILASLVYLIVVVGGLTRLTESGLSITEWNPGFKGMKLPITTQEWMTEWDKYKQTPEFQLLNSRMSLDDFKTIYMWEWGHRILGRVIGVAFVLPTLFFLSRGWVSKGTRWKLFAIATGIGFQGFLGWFMVQSGLSVPESTKTIEANVSDASSSSTMTTPAEWTPRVSHFRLAAHLGTAFLVYLAMLHTGLSIQRDHKAFYRVGTISGVAISSSSSTTLQTLNNTLTHPLLRRHAKFLTLVTCLVFTTAMSGAMVAGLDAGLVYNEFPTMAASSDSYRITPPLSELFDSNYCSNHHPFLSHLIWRNFSQNPVTIQLLHRTLAMTSFVLLLTLSFKTFRLSRSYSSSLLLLNNNNNNYLKQVPRRFIQLSNTCLLTGLTQVSLGISTLIYMVPISLASLHQATSLILLSCLVAFKLILRPIPIKFLGRIKNKKKRIDMLNS